MTPMHARFEHHAQAMLKHDAQALLKHHAPSIAQAMPYVTYATNVTTPYVDLSSCVAYRAQGGRTNFPKLEGKAGSPALRARAKLGVANG